MRVRFTFIYYYSFFLKEKKQQGYNKKKREYERITKLFITLVMCLFWRLLEIIAFS